VSTPLIYDPYAYEIHEDPYPVYRRLRDEAPAYHNPERAFWALSRYHDVYHAFRDWETYSSNEGVALERATTAHIPMIIAMDPPRQAKLRRLISAAFTPRRVATMEPAVRALARKWLAPLLARREGDFIGDFAAKLPMDVVSTMIGVPPDDRDLVREWADTLLHRDAGYAGVPEAALAASASMIQYFADVVARSRKHPGDDLVTDLLAAEVDGERLAPDEIIGFCFLLAIAGNETTTKMLGNAVVLLHRHPDQRALVVRRPDRIPDAVEETVRFDNSTQMLARTATRDVSIHGRTIPAGSRVVLLIGAGNRDERVFTRADAFDVTRPAQPHLAFGYGMHVCLGASLARLEGRVALEEFLACAPDYAVDESGLQRVHSPNVRGYSRVPIRAL
jgi:cytochrome P450